MLSQAVFSWKYLGRGRWGPGVAASAAPTAGQKARQKKAGPVKLPMCHVFLPCMLTYIVSIISANCRLQSQPPARLRVPTPGHGGQPAAAVGVADGAGQRVGRVAGRAAVQAEQALHHVADLFLGGLAVAHHGLL